MLYPYPGYCGTGVQNSEVPGTGTKVLHTLQKSRVLRQGRTELTEVLGTGMNVLQNLQISSEYA